MLHTLYIIANQRIDQSFYFFGYFTFLCPDQRKSLVQGPADWFDTERAVRRGKNKQKAYHTAHTSGRYQIPPFAHPILQSAPQSTNIHSL